MPRMTIFRSRMLAALVVLGAVVAPVATAAAQPPSPAATYTVKPGDTLMSIARAVLGDASRWREIFDLNTDRLSDPGLIYPGQVLRVTAAPPAAAETAAAPEPARLPPDMPRPQPQPERPVVVIEEPAASQDPAPRDSLFARRRGVDAATALRTYREQPYEPLRKGEFYSSGFLTEGESLAMGRLLGDVTPQQIRSLTDRAAVPLQATVAVLPPAGASYQVGDSLLLAQLMPGPRGYGEVVYPTGLARVTGHNGRQALATVVAVYSTVRNGQAALPAERFAPGGASRAQRVENGVAGTVLGQRDARELKQPQNVLFLDVGRRDGVARGDIFELRRDPGPRPGAADTMDELMAVAQVVHVRERSATVRLLNVVAPDIPVGTRAVQVAKLPL
jgi:murein DD-endopeptidase MepM/ murein hydrolase activator NlpD